MQKISFKEVLAGTWFDYFKAIVWAGIVPACVLVLWGLPAAFAYLLIMTGMYFLVLRKNSLAGFLVVMETIGLLAFYAVAISVMVLGAILAALGGAQWIR